MSRKIFTILSFLMLAVMTTIMVSADNPHFLYANASLSGNRLCVNFKEVGLGTVSTTDVTLEATAITTFGCVNRGAQGTQPSGLQTITTNPNTTGTFPVRNGQTTGNICLSPPTASQAGFSCPDQMRPVLVSNCFTDVTLSGEGGSESLGSFGTCP